MSAECPSRDTFGKTWKVSRGLRALWSCSKVQELPGAPRSSFTQRVGDHKLAAAPAFASLW
eukprot:1014706-Alexandrium_andersonii.AAC.1